MDVLSKIKHKIKHKIDSKIGTYLRKRYSSFQVTRPYNIIVSDNQALADKVAVVTGGSGAIGRACCVRLAAEGAKVYVCGSKEGSSNTVVKEIRSLGLKAESIVLNVLDAKQLEQTIDSIAKQNNGHIDILINSAGGSARGRATIFMEQSVEVIDEILSINLRGAMLCSRFVSKYMSCCKGGRIINISSVIGLQGKPCFSEYAASKGGINAFVKSLAQELGEYGITVNAVAPGIVQRGAVSEQDKERLQRTNWLCSYGKPEDISEMVAYLCSNKASFITGQIIAVDGGRSLGLKNG